MAVMLLVHDGKLRYDDKLAEIFPDFPDYGRAITSLAGRGAGKRLATLAREAGVEHYVYTFV